MDDLGGPVALACHAHRAAQGMELGNGSQRASAQVRGQEPLHLFRNRRFVGVPGDLEAVAAPRQLELPEVSTPFRAAAERHAVTGQAMVGSVVVGRPQGPGLDIDGERRQYEARADGELELMFQRLFHVVLSLQGGGKSTPLDGESVVNELPQE